jgi:predicted N-formylglutamate amidohydrolase
VSSFLHSDAPNAAATDWPEPVVVLNETGSSPVILICEHASNHIPAEYAQLGLATESLREHIAWDIGAADLTRELSLRLDAVACFGTYSRLLIDLNRPLGTPTSVLVVSEGTRIPGNDGLSPEESQKRARRIFSPFHDRIAALIAGRKRSRQSVVVVCIHSFAPVFHGLSRPFHMGVIFDKSYELALSVLGHVRRHNGLIAEANVPYQIHRDEDYAIPVYATGGSIPGVLIEIRNDLLANREGVNRWAAYLSAALEHALRECKVLGR